MRAFQQQAASDAARGVSGAGEQAALDQLNRRLDDFFSPFKRGYYVRFAQDNASGLRRLEIVSLRGNVRDTLDYVIPE
jgi:hypothetical protein